MAKPSKKPTKEVKTVVEPSIKVEGAKPHPIEVLYSGDQESMPEVKSVGYMKVPGTNQYVSYVITTKGSEVLKFEVEEPNLRAIAEESAKISFVTNFIDGQEF